MTNAVLAKLRAFVAGTPVEACALCSRSISTDHEHLLELDARRVFCACVACTQPFLAEQPAKGARYLRVERRALRLAELDFDDAVWAELRVPVGLAFFTTRSRTGEVVATFPGRAGLIESFVPLRAYRALERRFPNIKGILPDVEALLVRKSLRHQDYFRVSIDYCYELAGLLRGAQGPVPFPELAPVQAFFSGLAGQAAPRRHSKRPGF